jgi:zinc protease
MTHIKMKNIKKQLTALVLLVLCPLAMFAQKNAKSVDDLKLDPAVRTGKLPNGFTYYIRHNEEPKNRVVLYLANKVGSILEDDDQRGLAHFMEHMNFNGTKHFPKNELVNYLQKSGVRFGADINAYTGFDETVYQLPLPSDKPELLQNGLQIMRDWAQEATLDPNEINKERGVVLEEKRLGKGAEERMRRVYFPLILNHSRYADRMPIGIDTILDNFKPETINRFYRDWYRPDLQALIVVGDINVDEMEKTIRAKFNDLKNPSREKIRANYKAQLTGKNQYITVTDKEMTVTQAEILIKHPEHPLKTQADYKDYIMRTLINQMLDARYAELLRHADPPFISGNAGVDNFLAGIDVFAVSLTAKPGTLEKGLKAAWGETLKASRFGFTATELERAKQNFLTGMEINFKEKEKTPSHSYVNEYLQYFLKGAAAPGITREYQLVREDLPAISLLDINKAIRNYIKDVDRDIIIMAPEKDKASLPGQQTVEKWLVEAGGENLKPYQEQISSKPFLIQEPIPGKIVKSQSDELLKTTTLTFSNGVKVILKPTDFKNDEILFDAFAPGGTSLVSDADYQSASNAAAILSGAGLGNYNATELQNFLSGKHVSVGAGIDELYEVINGSTAATDLETALQLTYARFTEPRKDKVVFESYIARAKASLANRADDPNSVFADTISSIWSRGNVRNTGPSIVKMDQINLDRAYDIYKERFADASNFTFIFTGSFSVEAVKPLLEKYIGGLPSTYKAENYKDLGIRPPEGRIEKTVRKGSEPKATVNLVFSGKADYDQSEKIQLDALRETLQIRLLERLREDESGVYSPGVNANTRRFPESRYSFVVTFGCSPANVDKLVSSALDEISKLRTSGPPQINVDKFKAEIRQSRETSLKTNDWWLSYLSGNLKNQYDLHSLNAFEADMKDINQQSLKTAANKYLNGNNYIRLVLLPEK